MGLGVFSTPASESLFSFVAPLYKCNPATIDIENLSAAAGEAAGCHNLKSPWGGLGYTLDTRTQ